MNGFGGRIKNAGGRVKSGLLVLSVAGSLLATPGIAAAKPKPSGPPSQNPGTGQPLPTPPTTTSSTDDPPAGGITGHKVK